MVWHAAEYVSYCRNQSRAGRWRIPEDGQQLWAPVDELVPVSQRGSKGNKLNFVSAQALGLGGHDV